jgi:hypothetical protein
MAPEVWKGKVSGQSDQYSLAVAYAELRLDRRLFQAADLMSLMIAHVNLTPDLEPLNREEQKVLFRALSKEPGDRFETCLEFAQTLENALAHELGRTNPEVDAAAGPRGPRAPSGAETDMASFEKQAGVSEAERKQRAAMYETLAKGESGVVVPNRNLPSLVDAPEVPREKAEAAWRKPSLEKIEEPQKPGKEEPPPAPPPDKLRAVIVGMTAVAAILLAAFFVIPRKSAGPKPPDTPIANGTEPAAKNLPPNCQKTSEAQVVTSEGKQYYDKIDYVFDDGTRIRFLLIPKSSATDPPPFYIMENKVSNGLFRKFAQSRPVLDSQWEKGGLANRKDLGSTDDLLPVLRVGILDAQRFAIWLGGDLPTVPQWNKAAGSYEANRGEGPFLDPWDRNDKSQIAVNRGLEGPLHVGEAKNDLSTFGCRDMAGNGQEWTRDMGGEAIGRRVRPDYNPKNYDMVLLRGKKYVDPQPYRFNDADVGEDFQMKSPFIGFRVVLELQN